MKNRKGKVCVALLGACLAVTGCSTVRHDGSKAKLGDGYITTPAGEMSVGDAASAAAKLANLAAKVDPRAAMAASLLQNIGGGADENAVPKGWVVVWDHYLDGARIDPTRIQSVPRLSPESGVVITVTNGAAVNPPAGVADDDVGALLEQIGGLPK